MPVPPLPQESKQQSTWSDNEVRAFMERPVMAGGKVFPGTEGMTLKDVEDDILKGGRFRAWNWCVSLIVISYSRRTSPCFVRSTRASSRKAWFYSLTTMAFGWWSIHGLVYTFLSLWHNCRGGTDMTSEVLPLLTGPVRAQSVLAQARRPTLSFGHKLLAAVSVLLPIFVLSLLLNAIFSDALSPS